MGKYLHNDCKGEGNGGGEEAARCGVVSVSFSVCFPQSETHSLTQFKVAFADACLNNLQSTVGLPPFPAPFPFLCPCPSPLTPSQIEASDGRAPRVSSVAIGRSRGKGRQSRHRLSAVRVFRLLSSLALFINMLQVYPTLHSTSPFPSSHPPLYRLAFAATLFMTC